MNCCLECQAANKPTAAEIMQADLEAIRAADIQEAAQRIAANLSWGADGPPWARGKEAAMADRRADAAGVIDRWGPDAELELRAAVDLLRMKKG